MRVYLILLALLTTTPAWGLTCKNDYSGAEGCSSNVSAAGDCATLGYAKSEEEGCRHYIYCPFDQSYKRCVAQTETEKPLDCKSLGFTTQDKTPWCNHIITCPSDTTLTACGYDDKCLAYPLNLGPADDTWYENLPYGSKYETCDAADGNKYAKIIGCEKYYNYNSYAADLTKTCRSKCKSGDYYYMIDRYSNIGNAGFCSTTKLSSSAPLADASTLVGVVTSVTNGGYSGNIMALATVGKYGNGYCPTTSLTDGPGNTDTLVKSSDSANVCVQAAKAARNYSISLMPKGSWFLPAENDWRLIGSQPEYFVSQYINTGIAVVYMTSSSSWKLHASSTEGGLYNGNATSMYALPFAKFSQ